MSFDLIQEFIKQLVIEKIRSKTFNLNEFKKLETRRQMVLYAENSGLTELGEGSSRKTFLLSSGKVLKIAYNKTGVIQNEAEIGVSHAQGAAIWATKIFDFDQSNRWIIAELVREVTSQEFQKHFGMDISDMMKGLRDLKYRKTCDVPNCKAASSFLDFIYSADLDLDEFSDFEHWGKTADGRIVVLDTGFTHAAIEAI